jgi:apolipoprotein N-acyltransferase
VAVALLLSLLRNQSAETAFNLGLVYGAVYGLGIMYWFFGIFHVLAIPLIGLFAAYFGLLAGLVGLTKGWSPWLRAVLAGLFAVGVEWLRGDAWYLRFPWYTVPHALAQEPRSIAPVRWLGTYGFSFAIWAVAALGAFVHYRFWAALALIPAGWLLLPEITAPTHKALLIQGEETSRIERVMAQFSGQEVQLAVLPEYAYRSSPAQALTSPHGPAQLARGCDCPVIFGARADAAGKKFRNVAVVIDSRGRVLGDFTKQHPVPLFLDGVAGTERPVFPLRQGTLGIAICYDFDAPEVAADLVRRGATVLVAPTFDAMSWGRLQHRHHELLLRLRAVENDRWILRSASSGRSEAVNPHGEPSVQGVEIGETGFAIVAFAHSDSFPWGGQAHVLGPIAAAASGLVVGAYWLRRLLGRRRGEQTASGFQES